MKFVKVRPEPKMSRQTASTRGGMEATFPWKLVIICICGLALVGCRASAWDKAAEGLPAAQAAGKSFGIDLDRRSPDKNDLDERVNGAKHYAAAMKARNLLSAEQRKAAGDAWMELIVRKESKSITDRAVAELEKNKAWIDSIRTGANRRVWEPETVEDGLGDPDTSEYGTMRAGARAIAAEAVLDAMRGDANAAQRKLEMVMNIGAHVSRRGDMLSKLVSIAICKIGMRGAQRAAGELGPQFADAVIGLANDLPSPKIKDTFNDEAVLGVDYVRELSLGTADESLKPHMEMALKDGQKLETVRRAYETRVLEFWTKAAGFPEQTNQVIGKQMDDLVRQAKDLDETHRIISTLAENHEKIGNAFDSVRTMRECSVFGAILMRNPNRKPPARLSVSSSSGLTEVTDKDFRPMSDPNEGSLAEMHGFVYPFRGR